MHSESVTGRGAPRHTRPTDSPLEPPAARRKIWRSTCSLPALRYSCEPACASRISLYYIFPAAPGAGRRFCNTLHQAIALQPLQAGHLNKITVIVAKRDQAEGCATLEEVQPSAWFYMMFRNKTLSYFVQLHLYPQNPPP